MEIILWTLYDLSLLFPIHISLPYPTAALLFLPGFHAFERKTNREKRIHANRMVSKHCDILTLWLESDVRYKCLSRAYHRGKLFFDFDPQELVTTQFCSRGTHCKSMTFGTIWKSTVLRFSAFSIILLSTLYTLKELPLLLAATSKSQLQ